MNRINNYDPSIALEKLKEMFDMTDYWISGSYAEKKIREDYDYILETILELTNDRKLDHLRFAKKFKGMFKRKQAELEKEVHELKKEKFKDKMEKK